MQRNMKIVEGCEINKRVALTRWNILAPSDYKIHWRCVYNNHVTFVSFNINSVHRAFHEYHTFLQYWSSNWRSEITHFLLCKFQVFSSKFVWYNSLLINSLFVNYFAFISRSWKFGREMKQLTETFETLSVVNSKLIFRSFKLKITNCKKSFSILFYTSVEHAL